MKGPPPLKSALKKRVRIAGTMAPVVVDVEMDAGPQPVAAEEPPLEIVGPRAVRADAALVPLPQVFAQVGRSVMVNDTMLIHIAEPGQCWWEITERSLILQNQRPLVQPDAEVDAAVWSSQAIC